MARRHVDRKPGERLHRSGGPGSSRGPRPRGPPGGDRPHGGGGFGRGPRDRDDRERDDRGPGKRGPGKSGPGKSGPGKSGPGKRGPGGGGPGSRGPGSRAPGGFRGPKDRGPQGRSAQDRPVRGSKRRQQGLIVTPAGAPEAGAKDGKVRLNHFLAMSGVCSRRAADELIATGRVEVNGQLCTELGTRIDPQADDVRFDGSRVQPEKQTYVLFNKPKNVVCTNAKHEQKKRVIDFLPAVKGRLFTVGRLDLDSEGLILLTNDGSFALEMTHPRYGVPKLYAVLVRGRIEQHDVDKARGGVWLSEGPTTGMNIKVERTGKDRAYLKVTLREGKNREIRRVFAKLGYPVIELKRIRIGELNLHGLSPGEYRFLQRHEVEALRATARSAGDGAMTEE
jgi:23S rRNA pseudouridine2605 synthase